MKSIIFSVSLLAISCADVKVKMDDINGANVNDAKFAIFDESVVEILPGVNSSLLTVIASDREDLCDQIQLDPNAVLNLVDVKAITVIVEKLDELGEGGFVSGEDLISNTTLVEPPIIGAVRINTFVDVRQDNKSIIFASDISVANTGSIGVGNLVVNEIIEGESLDADFTEIIAADFANAADFDTDFNGDGFDDGFGVNSNVEINIRKAVFCDAIILD
jgi:hypothetical protein